MSPIYVEKDAVITSNFSPEELAVRCIVDMIDYLLESGEYIEYGESRVVVRVDVPQEFFAHFWTRVVPKINSIYLEAGWYDSYVKFVCHHTQGTTVDIELTRYVSSVHTYESPVIFAGNIG